MGIYEEYFKKPKAGILTLNNVKLEVGKMIYAKKMEKWICTSIVSIQLNDKDVDQVDNGEVGIVTDIELEKDMRFLSKLSSNPTRFLLRFYYFCCTHLAKFC